MKYIVLEKKRKSRKKDTIVYGDFYYFSLGSSKKIFLINNERIKNINIHIFRLAHPMVLRKVNSVFNKLIDDATDLLVSEDETGESAAIVLDKIEKFRIEVKTKYRKFLKQKELKEMALKLEKLQKVAHDKFMLLNRPTKTEKKSTLR